MTKENKTSWSIQFDHAAIATTDANKLRLVLRLMGLDDIGSEIVDDQKVKTSFWNCGKSTPNIEILEPTESESVVQKYLTKKGSGIHHLSFRVSDIQALSKVLLQNSIKLIYAEPKKGAHSTLVNFIHPESAGGILIEISQASSLKT